MTSPAMATGVRSVVLIAVFVALVYMRGAAASPARDDAAIDEGRASAARGSPAGAGSGRLIDPIRHRLAQLDGVLVKSERELRDTVMAHTLAGHIGEALAAMRELLGRFPMSVKGDDLYKAALLCKSAGLQDDAVGHLTAYLDRNGWTSVSSTSFLGTLYFEQGLYARAEGAFRMSIRLGARSPPVHTMSMLVATSLRLGHVRQAHSAYAALLGHSATRVIASGPALVRKIPLEFGALRIVPQSGAGGPAEGDGYLANGAVQKARRERVEGNGAREERNDRDEVARQIRQLQFPAECHGRPLLRHHLGDRRSGWGMGSMMHELVVALSDAHRLGRTLVLPLDDQWWYSAEDCEPSGFGCYFEPLSWCTERDSSDVLQSDKLSQDAREQQARHASLQWLPPRWRARGKTLLWWRSQLLAFVWRPLPRVLEHVDSRRAALAWPTAVAGATAGLAYRPRVLAVHVRRGDKGGGGRAGRIVVEMDTYIEQMEALVRALGPRSAQGSSAPRSAGEELQTEASRPSHVFLGGDDVETIYAFRDAAENFGMEVMLDEEEARTATDNSAMMLLSHEHNITRYALDAICNVELLSSADYFLGTFGSHLSRLAYELRVGRSGGFDAPPLTLDVLWFVNP